MTERVPHLGCKRHGAYLVELRNVMMEVAGIRRFGAAALDLAYVAAGRLDGYWEDNLQPWDMAASLLMVTKSGDYATDREGGRDADGIFDNDEICLCK